MARNEAPTGFECRTLGDLIDLARFFSARMRVTLNGEPGFVVTIHEGKTARDSSFDVAPLRTPDEEPRMLAIAKAAMRPAPLGAHEEESE